MATKTAPAAQSATKANNRGGLTSAPVTPPRKVTYVFNATTSAALKIPYAVAVDGAVLPAFAKKPGHVPGNGGKVSVTVLQGQRVSLYLNSDAASAWRQNPVYAVTAGERDVVVKITEKKGKHSDTDTPALQAAPAGQPKTGSDVDRYTAPLTGDIWMKVSHKYTEAEVDARLPAGTSEAVKAAVKSIYRGLGSATLVVTEAASPGKTARTVKVSFEDANNPKVNITAYTLLSDGLPRVHPGGYAAMFNAALEAGVTAMTVSSCWRPMLGSIAHRAGLGLDVSVVGGTVLNRQELRRAYEGKNASLSGNGNDRDNVTNAEVEAFGAYEKAMLGTKAAAAEVDSAGVALKAARKSGDAAAVAAAEERLRAAQAGVGPAAAREEDARVEWNAARDQGEPANARLFRTSLLKCSCVRQLFDPWFIDVNTQDEQQPEPNMQRGKAESLERLHAHHLHITVADTEIL